MKRYMVFAWDIYDNAAPFNCIQGSFDTIAEADECIKGCTIYQWTAIFDRVDGVAFKEVLRNS